VWKLKKKLSVALIIVGLILVSLGLFGTQGFTFAVVNPWSDNFNDNSLDTTRWTAWGSAGTVKEESQRLRFLFSGSGACGVITIDSMNLANNYVSITVVTFPTETFALRISTGNSGSFDFYDYVKVITGSTIPNRLLVRRTLSDGVDKIVKDSTFTTATGAMKIAIGSQADFYDNGNLIFSEPYALSTKNVYIWIYGYSASSTSWTLEVDDFLTTGSGTPLGSLNVKGYYDGVTVAMTNVYYLAPDGSTSPLVSVSAAGYTWTDLAVGSYTVYGTYQGTPKQSTVTVSSGLTAYAQLNFGGSTPPVTDLLQWLKDVLNNPIVKNGMLFGGATCLGIGVVTLVYPKKKQPYYYGF
jgi:hypothetical protein